MRFHIFYLLSNCHLLLEFVGVRLMKYFLLLEFEGGRLTNCYLLLEFVGIGERRAE